MFLALRLWKRLTSVLATLLLLVVLVPVVKIAWTGYRTDNAKTDAIVVLGAAQFDGTPSPVLQNRLDHALVLYRAGVAPILVTVGGSRPGDRFTEATAGRNYLHAKGVPWERIKAVRSGDDTFNSASAVARWARTQDISTFTVVSDRAHVARASTILQSYGFSVHSSAPQRGAGSAMTWQYVARETAGLLRFWFFKDSDFGSSLKDALDARPTVGGA